MYGDYDKNGVYLDFIDNKLAVTSQKSNASEEIEIQGNIKNNFNYLVDIQILKSILQNLNNKDTEIHFGHLEMVKEYKYDIDGLTGEQKVIKEYEVEKDISKSILIKENNISYVLCLLEKQNQM